LCGITPAATCAVTVAATSVWMSSTLPGVAAAEPSKLIPHSITRSCLVDGVATCSIVLMAVPVVTEASAAVVGMAPLYAM
jgi:hypothetical protein